MGRNQIYIPSNYVLQKSYSLGHQTLMLGNVLVNETDIFFGHQFNESAICPIGCKRMQSSGQKISQCIARDDWRELISAKQARRGDGRGHSEL